MEKYISTKLRDFWMIKLQEQIDQYPNTNSAFLSLWRKFKKAHKLVKSPNYWVINLSEKDARLLLSIAEENLVGEDIDVEPKNLQEL